jgi:hypothetical protein
MPEPRPEKREKFVKFVVVPGEIARDVRDRAPIGQVLIWFIRPEGSQDADLDSQPEGSLARILAEIYGEYVMDFPVDHAAGHTSEKQREAAQARADLLSSPEMQRDILDIVARKKKLEASIRRAEAVIEKKVKMVGTQIDRGTLYRVETWTRSELEWKDSESEGDRDI